MNHDRLGRPHSGPAGYYIRRRTVRVFGLVALLAVAISCSAVEELTIVVPEQTRAHWQRVVTEHPLPERFTATFVVTEGPDTAPALVLTRSVGGENAVPGGRSILLSRRYLVPTRPLWDFTRDLAAESVDRDALVPLDQVELPETARSVDGSYPGDEGYPFVEETWITLDLERAGIREDRRAGEALATWFADLDERADLAQIAARPEITWIGGAGDIMLERGMRGLLTAGDGLERVFSDVLPYLRDADFLLGNLEGAVSRRGAPLAKSFTFRFDPVVLGPLREAGFDYLSLVNNHSFDYGLDAFLDSKLHLDEAGILTSGVGNNLEEAGRVSEVTIEGLPIRVLSMGAYPVESSGFDGARETAATVDSPGVLWADPRNRVAQAAAFAAMESQFGPDTFDIVMIHGGFEWQTEPSGAQIALYRAIVDAGADLVLGHHSHVVQGLEAYNDGLIAYSLGNFVFPGMYLTEFGEESVLLKVGVVDGAIRYVEPIAVAIDHQLLSLDRDTALTERMQASTERLNRSR
jgi:poly-gamma-glutamate synthesis protein (capsule biosynthesis protein)